MDYKFINPEYLDSVSGGDTEIVIEIVNMFRDQSHEIFNEMKNHLEKKNYTMLGLLSHKAKSSVMIMGMNDLGLMLKTLELNAKTGLETELYESYVNRFKIETDAAILELEDLIKNQLNKS
jgi:hypothetical protein